MSYINTIHGESMLQQVITLIASETGAMFCILRSGSLAQSHAHAAQANQTLPKHVKHGLAD